MIRHIVSWSFPGGYTGEKKDEVVQKMREDLQKVKEDVTACLEMNLHYPLLDTSSAEICLNTLFTDVEGLMQYQTHPVHLRVIQLLKENLTNRVAVDYEEN